MTTQEAPTGLRVLHVSELSSMGEVNNCLAVVWLGQPTPDEFRKRNDFLIELAQRAPKKCALVELVDPNAKPPSQETRKVAMEVFKKLGPDLSAIGFVLEGNEMRSALIRAQLTGMMFFVKQLQPTKIFKRTSDMADWVRPRVQSDDPKFTNELQSAFEHLRQLVTARGAAKP